jgi:hypothetical protein
MLSLCHYHSCKKYGNLSLDLYRAIIVYQKDINKLETTQEIVTIPAPKGPKNLPKRPLRHEPIKGKKTIFKYIFKLKN